MLECLQTKCGRTDGRRTKTNPKTSPEQSDINKTNANKVTSRKTAPIHLHVFQWTGTIFELNSRILETNVLIKLHGNWAKNLTSKVENCPAHRRPCFFLPIWIIFEHARDINKTNVSTKFHDDWQKMKTAPTQNVTSRRTLPRPLVTMFFPIWTIFELVQDINKTNVLTNFYDDWAKQISSAQILPLAGPAPPDFSLTLLHSFDLWYN
ncbi:hypothetical protein DPMN_014986 [Dreissena polymorpha]|uniref:Uncharacterized protein n=1 Tax=Dreissena polymorpha TaxID=45954 RepID=A0A9D4S414_DREPO|nr:hypothetical protein DPMN_014986 [Dreissena polymorpha]